MVAKKTVRPGSYDYNALATMMDRGANVLYRWIRFPAGTVVPYVISCFDKSLVDIGGDTNLLQANRMSPPEQFLVRSIHSFWDLGSRLEDRIRLSEYRADLVIAHRTFFSSPIIALTDLGLIMPKLPAKIDPKMTDLEKEMQEMNPGVLGEYPRIIPSAVYFDVKLTGTGFQTQGDLAYCLVLNGWWDRGVL